MNPFLQIHYDPESNLLSVPLHDKQAELEMPLQLKQDLSQA